MEKIWLKNYPNNVPAEINPDTYQSLVDVFEKSCTEFADLPAFNNFGVTLTYQELDTASRAVAAYLQQTLQLKKGDRFAIMLPNVLQYPIVLFGALRAGLVMVNINPLYTARELSFQLNDSGAESIIVLENFASTVEQVLSETKVKNIIVASVTDFFAFPKAAVIYFFLKYIKKKIPAWHIPQAVTFKNILSQGKKLSLQPVKFSNCDIAFLQYTGGTTGISKGAMLTHRNMIANILQAEAWFASLLTKGEEIIITALPLYHIFSLLASALFLVKMGGFNILITNPRDIPRMISTMSQFKFTVITGVNTLFNALLNATHFAELDFSGLKLSLGGGAAVQRAVAEKWKAVTGHTLLEAYGLTEASPCVTLNPPYLKEYNATIGLPVSSTDIAILDESGSEVAIGQSGELAVKGPQVMYGYWNNVAETKKVFTHDGWLLTGDMALVDPEGFVHLIDRKKDMILVSGFNVYPNEIEDVLVKMPGILEAAVIGVPDESSGETVKAFLVRSNPDLTIDDVMAYCHAELTGYKRPKYIEFCEDLPKTNVGKILRRALRK